ncbi:hypothetical protein [Tenacibaculum jejuense]|uniref:Anti-sigma factor n=1 Tax=Tenacibaculum jejuense TaxID=584609 RepID=A0A238U7W9_9FLAO|nr:hypothetical protein [Tenacibaculum jejuense]SNR15281.1 Probable transmembrane protein of unknown function; putative anti ECF-type sigma facto [Tenacibaculum jejuense]
MPKDIRNVVRDFEMENIELSQNHEARFLNKLEEAFPEKKKSFQWLYAVASIVVLLGLGIKFYPNHIESTKENVETEQVNLGEISPEMKKIEDYYLTAINYEIASLNETQNNKALLDEYFEKISKLDTDYKRLNQKLKKEGITNKTINSLITNLQLRLQLLIHLKDQLNDLQTKENNNESIVI